MSTEAVIRFRKAVNADESLQDELRAMEKMTPKALSHLAAARGFSCTPDELRAVARSLVEELTEFELEMVTGGTDLAGGEVERAAPLASKAAAVTVAPEIEDDEDSC